MADNRLLSAGEAAELLGVSRQTLYAYVSRGQVESRPGPGPSRARRYPRASLEALRARRATPRGEAAAREAIHWGAPVLESSLTLIEDGRCFYRGRDVVALSREAGLEEVAALIWSGDAGDVAALGAWPAVRPRTAGPVAARLEAHLTAAAHDGLPPAPGPPTLRAAAAVVAGMFAAAGARGAGPLAGRLARGWRAGGAADDLRAALVLCADHELNASAFTARVVASAGARLEHALLAALAALQGRRHGGAPAAVARMLADAARDGPGAAIERAMDERGAVPGFGHPLYPDGDPRGLELLRLARAVGAERLAGVEELVGACAALGLAPDLDLGLVALAEARRLPPDAPFTVFALGRSVGWVAHALETIADGRLIRPRARYVGPRPGDATLGAVQATRRR
jgi:citrate synthase